MGARACQRYFLSAETFDAQEAHRLGLVQMVASLENLGDAAGKLVTELLAGKREALSASKLLIRHVRQSSLDDRLVEDTARRLAEIRATEQARNAVAEALKR
jgi:methylglutaconyl-CoA hydratase